MTRHLIGLAAAALCLAILLPTVASARPAYPGIWSAAYPGSSSLTNAAAGGSQCLLCHQNIGGGQPYNQYGWNIRQDFIGGNPIATAIANAEPLDSDGDPGGNSNLAEINANAQPGWTPGPNNTVFFNTGGTVSGQIPPGGIAGTLDPAAPVPFVGVFGQFVLGVGLAGAGAWALGRRSSDAAV